MAWTVTLVSGVLIALANAPWKKHMYEEFRDLTVRTDRQTSYICVQFRNVYLQLPGSSKYLWFHREEDRTFEVHSSRFQGCCQSVQ